MPAVVSDKDGAAPHLESLGGGRFALKGDLTFDTAMAVLEESREPFSRHEALTIDLSGVARADSAGHALLLEWKSWAANGTRRIRFENIPSQILAVARMSDTENVLLEAEPDGPV